MPSKKKPEGKKQTKTTKATATKNKTTEPKQIQKLNILDTIIKNMEAQNVSVNIDG